MSIAGGLAGALERGAALRCGAVQIFLKNQRRWAARPLAAEDVAAFAAARRRTAVRHVFAHASYLINLAASSSAARRQAIDAFTDELERGEALGLACVVIHPGSHLGEGLTEGLARVTQAVNESLRRTEGYRIAVALENTAGGGHTVGRTLAELGELVRRSARPERVGVCLDTCHLFAAGYDIRTPAGWRAVLDEGEAAFGLGRILAWHLNDAKTALGSGLDRHEHIGAGALGRTPFRLLLREPRLAGIPKVLETPKQPDPQADRRNLKVLRTLRLSGRS
jgi:deoxyribonuclease IV